MLPKCYPHIVYRELRVSLYNGRVWLESISCHIGLLVRCFYFVIDIFKWFMIALIMLNTPIEVTPVSIPVDKINSLVQKELQMKAVGVTRRKYLIVIAEALEAVEMKKSDKLDEQGKYPMIEVPCWELRRWGAEQASKLFGDQIERKEIEHDIGDKTLDRFKSLSVAELKERAQAILKGSPVKHIASPAASNGFDDE